MLLARKTVAKVVVATLIVLPAAASAQTATLASNATIVDHSPFYSIGAEDVVGTLNYALNNPSFIDIPYAIFNFGAVTSVSSATLTWNFNSLFGGSPPASISLYVGSDASGTITTGDRFMGTLIDTFVYSGGELRSYDVTAYVNAALGASQGFAARLEATVPPAQLNGYYGGLFNDPSLAYTVGVTAAPEPATFGLVLFGAGALAGVARRRTRRA